MGTIVGISGNFGRPSRTRRMVEVIIETAATDLGWESRVFDLMDAGPSLGATYGRKNAPLEIERIWTAI